MTYNKYFTMKKTFEERVIDLLAKYCSVEENNETESNTNKKHLKLIKCSGLITEQKYDLRSLNLELFNGRTGKSDRSPKKVCTIRKI